MILIPKYQNMLQLTGSLSIVLLGEDMKLKQEIYVPNTIVTTGKDHIASRLGATTVPTKMEYMGIGTNATSVVPGDDDLIAEVGSRIQMSGTSGQNSVSVLNSTVTYSATFPPDNPPATQEIREAAIFNAGTLGTGVMLCRTVFPIVTKQTGDTLTITWAVTVS